MSCTDEEKTFKSQEICNIIKLCGANGVKSISFEGVEIKFFDQAREEPIPQVSEQIPIVQDNATKDSIIETEDDFLNEVRVESQAQELAIMQLEDPARYEELLANPEIIQEFSQEIERLEGENHA